MKKRGIPKTDSVKKLAAFWDTHDLADYEADLVKVRGTVFERQKPHPITVNLKPQEAAAVKQIAKASKTGCKPLLHKWIAEAIRRETANSKPH